mmetsp:Transcript_33343/g.96630  ORF Transcript_33343/g.96630 Transcript_33343/m.96630 type:complete len:247 (+) Transcript_33343:1109-1849(+)
MGHGVVRHDQAPPSVVHHAGQLVPNADAPGVDLAQVNHIARVRLDARDVELLAPVRRGQEPRVVDLTTSLGIERGLGQHEPNQAILLLGQVNEAALQGRVAPACENGHHCGSGFACDVLGGLVGDRDFAVHQEARLFGLHEHVLVRVFGNNLARLLVCFHDRLVLLLVHGHSPLLGHDLGQVHREAQGAREEEGQIPRHDVDAFGLELVRSAVEMAQATPNGLVELLLLALEDLGDLFLVVRQFRE